MDSSGNGDSDKTTFLNSEETLNREIQKAKDQEACLIIIRGTPQGHRFFISQGSMSIGRDPTADIQVADQSISRKHASISLESDGAYLTDLKSSNGTFINGKKLGLGERVRLSKEDMIKMGNTILKFLPKGELEILFYGNLGSAAHTDSLTQIYNKGYLVEALEAEFKRARALGQPLSVLFFDLDHFKKINDTYGHAGGDFVLKEICQLVKTRQLRPKDVFARYGGEEFVIVLGQTPIDSASQIAEQIRKMIADHSFEFQNQKIPVSTSIGVAEISSQLIGAPQLLEIADKALYEAKRSGRNKVVLAK